MVEQAGPNPGGPPVIDDRDMVQSPQSTPEPGSLEHYLAMIPEGYVVLRAMIELTFETGQEHKLSDARVSGWVTEMDSDTGAGGRAGLIGAELEDQIRDDIAKYVITEEVIMSHFGVSAEGAQDLILGANEGGANFGDVQTGDETGAATGATEDETGLETLQILRGSDMSWFFDPDTGNWYVRYGLPGSDSGIVFEASEEQMDSLFGPASRPQHERASLKTILNDDNFFGENITEMAGEGSFEAQMERAIAVGIDEGLLPPWAADDPEVMALIYVAQTEGKSDEWLINEISETESFKERFPGIDTLKAAGNLTWSEAVTGYLEFEGGLKTAMAAIGEDPESVTGEVVAGMLETGHNLETVATMTTNWKRMVDYAPSLQAFNSILVEQGLAPVETLQDMYDFVAGQAPAELYDVWEASSFQEAATAAGLTDVFTAEDAMDFALQTEGNMSLESSMQLFQSLAQTLLRFRGELDMEAYSFSQDDIIDMSLGRAPASGASAAELQADMSRAVSAAQASLKQKGGLFKNFGPGGRPGAVGLQSLRQSN